MKDCIWKEIDPGMTIGIAGHVRPDGDCIGSVMSLYNYLVKCCPDQRIDAYLEYIPEEFSYISHTDKVRTEWTEDVMYDVFFSLDCGDKERIGVAAAGFAAAGKTINIDHHISNLCFADINHVEAQASSTCEVLFYLFDEERVDTDIARSLYTGIIHDTGVFKHSNTSRRTMEAAGVLIEKGVDFSKIIDESFYQKTYLQNQILGRCLLESIMVLDGRCIFSVISQKMMNFYGAGPGDLDGVVDQLRITKGVEVAILLHETDQQEYKVSLRSNGIVNVSSIAVYFGGGGHIKAAGCSMKGSIHDVINNLTLHIEVQLKAN